MISLDNLISALIGSTIGIFISGTYGRLNNAIKINNYRNLILTYSKFIVIKKVENYCENYIQAKSYIKNYLEVHNNNLKTESKYDSMPMFNSEIFKSIPNEFLYKVFLDNELYADFLDTVYSIDFLKNNMPSEKIKKFSESIKNHIEYQKIEPKNVNHHLESCSTLQRLIENFQIDSDLKIRRAKAITEEVVSIDKKLSGNNFLWICKYFFKQ